MWWVYNSYQEFLLEAANGTSFKRKNFKPNKIQIFQDKPTPIIPLDCGKGPPVIVATEDELPDSKLSDRLTFSGPVLEGLHPQKLPRLSGQIRGNLQVGLRNDERLIAWLVPYPIGTQQRMSVTIPTGKTLQIDCSKSKDCKYNSLRKAANFLLLTPSIFAFTPSIDGAYTRLERLWNSNELDNKDPRFELLLAQSRKLRGVLENLSNRPRSILKTEHRMLKLQSVRRVDDKTLKWLMVQPGRNTAERAGSKQRVKAPKRYETINTLENRVLLSFVKLSVQECEDILDERMRSNHLHSSDFLELKTHQELCYRTAKILQASNLNEVNYPVHPNFPLRFDPQYKQIWDSWIELIELKIQNDLELMWQHRTYAELLSVRAAMKLFQEINGKNASGSIAHSALLGGRFNQGCYLKDRGFSAVFGLLNDQDSKNMNVVEFSSLKHDDRAPSPLGSIARIFVNSEQRGVLWPPQPETCSENSQYYLTTESPWSKWDLFLETWIQEQIS